MLFFALKCLRNDVTAAERKVEELMELRREEQVRTADALISRCVTEFCILRQQHWCMLFFAGENKKCR